MTEKLYYKDAYATVFDAVVRACEEIKNGYAVVLDQTLFYPEGGGQPCDIGVLENTPVTEVHEKDGVIFHHTPTPLPVGQRVRGEINWERRFDLMQNHSGEHILSGIICKKYGCDNVGFHMGRDKITIDLNHRIPEEDLCEIEEKANEAIWKNTPITIAFPEKSLRDSLEYRSKIQLSGEVRIVTSGAYDCCACCGTHVAFAGEIGIIKIVGSQNYKGGTRLELLSGKRALAHYREKNTAADGVGKLLSVSGTEILAAVENHLLERDEMIQQLNRRKNMCFDGIVGQLPEDSENVCYYEAQLSGKDLTSLGDKILTKIGGRAMVLTPSGEGYAFVLLSTHEDARQIVEEMKTLFSCKGGVRQT